jgi:hypothetical protein
MARTKPALTFEKRFASYLSGNMSYRQLHQQSRLSKAESPSPPPPVIDKPPKRECTNEGTSRPNGNGEAGT